jgi:adhesin transport system membrane fusion protein
MLKIANSKSKLDDNLFKEKLNAIEVLKTPRASEVLVYWLLGFLCIFMLTLFLPWQQNIRAEGKVTTLTPSDRPQKIESTIAGKIQRWKITEGQYVNKGDTILVLTEVKEKFFDPELLKRTAEQVEAKKQAIVGYESKIVALDNQINALQDAVQFSLEKARNKLRQTQLKLFSDSTDWEAEKINFQIAKRQLEGQQVLYDKSLVSLTALESRKLKFQESNAKVISLENKVLAARNEVLNARIELSSLQAEYADKISKAQSDRSSAISALAAGQGELSKMTNEYANMKIRSEQYYILAPQDGFIVKSMQAGIGEVIKEGDAVVSIMPDSPQIAVELYVKAMDVPLLSLGRHARIEFDGWPAIQFSGWPSIAVGTFGGEVAVIDQVDSKEGKYRILIKPDETDDAWPERLRQGSGARGWVMLDDVQVWFEIWRQLNGFPPTLQNQPDDLHFGDKSKGGKGDKDEKES